MPSPTAGTGRPRVAKQCPPPLLPGQGAVALTWGGGEGCVLDPPAACSPTVGPGQRLVGASLGVFVVNGA